MNVTGTCADMNLASELETYRAAVESLMKLKSSEVISNSIPEHAAVLFEVFFSHAKDQVRMFCRNLHHQVFGNARVVAAAQQAVLRRDVQIRILTQESPEPSAFLDFLQSGNRNVSFAKVKSEQAKRWPFNFTVMDDHAFRCEPNRDVCKAFAVMHEPTTTKLLIERFDALAASALFQNKDRDAMASI